MVEEDKQPGEGQDPAPAPLSAAEVSARIQANLKSMGLLDKVVLVGSAVLLLLSLFRWFGNDMAGVNGWEDYHVLGLLACIGALAVTLLKMENPHWLQAALAGGAWIVGPLAFWLRVDAPEAPDVDGMGAEFRRAMTDAMGSYMPSFTFIFWLAFLGGLAAAGAAGWKLWEQMQKKA